MIIATRSIASRRSLRTIAVIRQKRRRQAEVLTMAEDIQAGHYAQKQIFSRSTLIAWSHRSRFRLAREIVRSYAGRRLLDYGCGDGTFLAQVVDLFPRAVGADIDPRQNDDCRKRFAK